MALYGVIPTKCAGWSSMTKTVPDVNQVNLFFLAGRALSIPPVLTLFTRDAISDLRSMPIHNPGYES